MKIMFEIKPQTHRQHQVDQKDRGLYKPDIIVPKERLVTVTKGVKQIATNEAMAKVMWCEQRRNANQLCLIVWQTSNTMGG
jgi:hypothetical protein